MQLQTISLLMCGGVEMTKPTNNAITTITECGWYFADEEAGVYRGPYATRETALKDAHKYCEDKTRPIHLSKGHRPSIRISTCICEGNIDDLLFEAERSTYCEFGVLVDNSFGLSNEQKADLLALVRRALDEWQVKNSIAVKASYIEAERDELALPNGTIVGNDAGYPIHFGTFVEAGDDQNRSNALSEGAI